MTFKLLAFYHDLFHDKLRTQLLTMIKYSCVVTQFHNKRKKKREKKFRMITFTLTKGSEKTGITSCNASACLYIV